MYLGLRVDASQLHARYPTDATQELDQILLNYVYGAFTLYGEDIPVNFNFFNEDF